MYHLNEITELETLINKVQDERFQLQLAQNDEIADVLNSHFNYFKELTIKVSNSSAYFYMFDEDLKREKEILSLYFYERYNNPTKLELSYYSSSSNSDFELDRLMYLGSFAKVIKQDGERILNEIVAVQSKYKNRSNELYAIQDGYNKQKRAYQEANDEARKAEVKLALMGEGVKLSKKLCIDFKYNYSANVRALKLINISKSGKTCDVVFNYAEGDGYRYTERKCNVEKIVDQVARYHESIIEELLPQ